MNKSHIVQDILTRGVTYSLEADILEKNLQEEVLTVKFGIDPTGPQIHLGRAIPFWKLRQLQDLGHHIILIIGDFTARIGDASDKDTERPMLSKEAIQHNLKGYFDQISLILDMSQLEIRYNSEWLDTLSFDILSEIADIFSVNEMLARDNFYLRHQAHTRISLREFLYPLIQGYDSVMVKSDLEIGGNDQYFNLMAGRKVQKHFGQSPQHILTFELLRGIDGRKMSTSWGNGIYITDTPNDMFTKVMKIQDDLLYDYFRLATDIDMPQIEQYMNSIQDGVNPRDIKLILAYSIVKRYYSDKEAEKAQTYFCELFTKQSIPQDIPQITIDQFPDTRLFAVIAQSFHISNSEAKRAIQDGGVRLNQHIVKDIFLDLQSEIDQVQELIIQKGKGHILKIVSCNKI
jgi:tyrosyl-tRNA synthetase